MRKLCILFVLLILNISAVVAAQTKVKTLRIRSTAEKTRLVFDVSAIPKHKVFQLKNPDRLVIDFKNTYLEKKLSQPAKKHALLARLRTANRNKKDLRVVIDLQDKVAPKSFLLKANKKYGPRLVVDLPNKNKKLVAKQQPTKKSKAVKDRIAIPKSPKSLGESKRARTIIFIKYNNWLVIRKKNIQFPPVIVF